MEQIAGKQEGPKTPAIRVSGEARQLPARSRPWLNKATIFGAVVTAVLVLVVMIMAGKSADEPAIAIKPAPDRVAKVLRRSQDGVFCATSTYNNATGEFSKEKIEPCEAQGNVKRRPNTMMNWQRD